MSKYQNSRPRTEAGKIGVNMSSYYIGEPEESQAKIMCLPRRKVLAIGADYWEEGPTCFSDLKNFVFAVSACLWEGYSNESTVIPSMNKDLDKIYLMIVKRLDFLARTSGDQNNFLDVAELKDEVISVIREQVYYVTKKKKRSYDSTSRIIHKFIWQTDADANGEYDPLHQVKFNARVVAQQIKYKQQAGNRRKSKSRKDQVFEIAVELFELIKELPSLKKIQAYCKCGQELAKQALLFLRSKSMTNESKPSPVPKQGSSSIGIADKFKRSISSLEKAIKSRMDQYYLNLSQNSMPTPVKASPVPELNTFVIEKAVPVDRVEISRLGMLPSLYSVLPPASQVSVTATGDVPVVDITEHLSNPCSKAFLEEIKNTHVECSCCPANHFVSRKDYAYHELKMHPELLRARAASLALVS